MQIYKDYEGKFQVVTCFKKATDLGCVKVQTSGAFLKRDMIDVASLDREGNPPTQSLA